MHLTRVSVPSPVKGEALIKLLLDREVWVSPHAREDELGWYIQCSLSENEANLLLKELRRNEDRNQ